MVNIQTSILYINITYSTDIFLQYCIFVYSTYLTMMYTYIYVCLLYYLILPEDFIQNMEASVYHEIITCR